MGRLVMLPLTERIGALERRLHVVTGGLQNLATKLDVHRAANQSEMQALVHSVENLRRVVESRMTELDVKVRPLLDFEDAYGIRLADGYVLVPKEEDTFRLMLADATSGGLEPGTRRCIISILRPGMVAVDVGANIGLLTLACARAVGAEGRVIALEPEERIGGLLERAIKMNGTTWVKVLRCAAGSHQYSAQLNVSVIPGHSSLLHLPEDDAKARQKVDVIRLDDELSQENGVDLVKMDVEGAELEVLKGLTETIARNPDIALIAEFGEAHLNRAGVKADEWFAAFTNLGFNAYLIDESTQTWSPATAAAACAIPSVNVVFAKPGSQAERRLCA
jgi:FkbM family methyltransferase